MPTASSHLTNPAVFLPPTSWPGSGKGRGEASASSVIISAGEDGGEENEAPIGGGAGDLAGELAAITLEAHQLRADARRMAAADFAHRAAAARRSAHPALLVGILAALRQSCAATLAGTVARIEGERRAKRRAAISRHHARQAPGRRRRQVAGTKARLH